MPVIIHRGRRRQSLYELPLWLTRRWSGGQKAVLFIGLNPSRADQREDDATIRKCVGFARRWGANGVVMVNLCAWRDCNPKVLGRVDDPMGPKNGWQIVRQLIAEANIVVAAWGQIDSLKPRDLSPTGFSAFLT